MNVIIIEDEPRTANDLNTMLKAIDSDIQVLATLTSVAAAVKWFNENNAPDLIFSDIQLGDGLSFEIFRKVNAVAPIIFCTAYDQYAVDAFESNSIDYLLKPIEEEMVTRSLEKFNRIRHHYASKAYAADLSKTLAQMDGTYRQSILVYSKVKMIPVRISDVSYIRVANGVVSMVLSNESEFTVQYTIDQMEAMLNPSKFFRANRQYIVNHSRIQVIEHYFNRRLTIRVLPASPEKIIVSRLKAREFLKWVEQS